MFPVVFKGTVFGFSWVIPSGGLFLFLAFVGAYALALRRVRRDQRTAKELSIALLLVLSSSAVGAAFFAWIVEKPTNGYSGQTAFYGGFLGALFSIVAFCRVNRREALPLLDVIAPSVAFGVAIGRIGCFLAGCCWGTLCSLPWAVRFPDGVGLRPPHEFVHPVQLYAALGAMLLYFYLERLYVRQRYTGQTFFSLLLGYGGLRFVWEFFRGDVYRGFLFEGGPSTSQAVSILLFMIAAVILSRRRSAYTT